MVVNIVVEEGIYVQGHGNCEQVDRPGFYHLMEPIFQQAPKLQVISQREQSAWPNLTQKESGFARHN